MARIDAQDSIATDCDIAFLAEGDGAFIDARGANTSRSRIGMMATDSGVLGGLGFPPGTDTKEIAELLKVLAYVPEDVRPRVAKESSLIRSIAMSTNDLSKILANVQSAVNNPMIMSVVKQLGF